MLNLTRCLGLSLVIFFLHAEASFASCKPFPWVLAEDTHVAEYSGNEYHHTILVIPPTGGETFLDRGLATDLCERGARVLIVQSWKDDQEPATVLDLGRHDRLTERAVRAMKRVIDWSGAKKVGVVGASLGGMYASFLISSDSRVAAAVFVVAGGPTSEVIAYGDQEHLNGLREERRKAYGYRNNQEYERALSEAIQWDNNRLALPELKDRVSFFIGEGDVTVPTEQQWKLYQAWGSPESLKIFKCNHIVSIFRAYQFNRNWIARQLFTKMELTAN